MRKNLAKLLVDLIQLKIHQVENLEKDFYINEAVNVLGDLNLNLDASKKLAQNKK